MDEPLTSTELLAAEPAAATGIGYARVSTGGQKLERQLDALTAAGCRRIFAEKKSGKDGARPELIAAVEFTQVGDTLVVPALDRLGRSLQDLITIVGDLRRREIGFTSLHENLDTTTPGGRLVFHVFAALAEFIRELIVSGTLEGRIAAGSAAGPPWPRRLSSARRATCCPTLLTASPRSPSCSGSVPGRSTTTSPTCANYAAVPAPSS